jgi:ferredoxin
MKVSVDGDICQGHTLCHLAAPAIFQLRDEDGHAYVEDPTVPPELEEAARKALLTCPEGAISLL